MLRPIHTAKTQPWVVASSPKRSLESQRLWKDLTCCLSSPTVVIPPTARAHPFQMFGLQAALCIEFSVPGPQTVECWTILLSHIRSIALLLHDCLLNFSRFSMLDFSNNQKEKLLPSPYLPPQGAR